MKQGNYAETLPRSLVAAIFSVHQDSLLIFGTFFAQAMALREIGRDSAHQRNANAAKVIDMIAVHGLDEFDAHGKCSDYSWKDPAEKDLDSGWLEASVRKISETPDKFAIRLFFYSFDSRQAFCAKNDGLSEEATSLLKEITTTRSQEAANNPIVFLGQGLGGLLIKQALVNASSSPEFSQVKHWTKGIAFFGTRHSPGSELEDRPSTGFFQGLFGCTATTPTPGLHLPPISSGFRDMLEDFFYISYYSKDDQSVSFNSVVLGLPGSRETQIGLVGSTKALCNFSVDSDNYRTVTRSLLRLCDRIAKL